MDSKGQVKWWNDERGFGFITATSGEDLFVHSDEIQSEDYPSLEQGQWVEFKFGQGRLGPMALNVRALGEPDNPHLQRTERLLKSGVKCFVGGSIRELEFRINDWAEATGAVVVGTAITPRSQLLGALVTYTTP